VLLDLQKQGFNPDTSVIDGASGLKAGYEEALPKVLLIFDHFHITKDGKDVVRYLKNIKESDLTTAIKLSNQRDKAKTPESKRSITLQLKKATSTYEGSEQLYQDLELLAEWFQYDVLQFASVPPAEREELYDFIIEELQLRAHKNDRVQKFLNSLIYQRTSLMKAIYNLDSKLVAIKA
jgi:hypothetical protein